MSLLDRERIVQSFFPSQVFFVFVSFKPLCFCPPWSLVAIRKVTDPQYLAMATFGRAGNEPSTPFISCANFLAANTICLTIDLKLSFLNLLVTYLHEIFFLFECHQTKMAMKWQIQLHWFCLILTLPTHTQTR